MKTKVIAATILCDRKASSQMIAIPKVLEIEGLAGLYINIETYVKNFGELYKPLADLLSKPQAIPVAYDVWRWNSLWRQGPNKDQDQRRLLPIVHARNMARDYALCNDATHLLFIDADVVPTADGLQKLLDLKHPITGGIVPGRGAHSHVQYIFGPTKARIAEHPNVIECAHGTCGYMLIERQVLSELAFRYGASRIDHKEPLSEDPAFCEDARLMGYGYMWLHREVRAKHWDDPRNPMTDDQTSDHSDWKIPI